MKNLLTTLGYRIREETDYGFMARRGEVELGKKYCVKQGDQYSFDDCPPAYCPQASEGLLNGVPVRCVSWEAMFLEKLTDPREIPWSEWQPKDHESFEVIASQPPSERRR